MSLCLFLLTEDSVYIGTDSAITIAGKRSIYDIKKINQLNDGKLLFIAGTVETSIKINKELSQYDEITVDQVQKLLREKLQSELENDEELRKRYNEGKEVISAFLFTPAREVYLMAAQSNFEAIVIDSEVQPGTVKVHAAGHDVKKAYDEAVRLVTSGKGLTSAYILNKAFEHVSGGKVGGHLTITRIDDRGVHMSEPRKIKETLRVELSDDPLYKPNTNAHMIASDIIGGTVTGAHITTNQGTYPFCEMSSDNNVFRAAKSPTSFIEIEADPASYNAPMIKHVNGSTTTYSGIQSGSYFIGVGGGNLDLSTSSGNININAGTGYSVNINRLRPSAIDLTTTTVSGLLQSDVSGLVSRLTSIESRLSALE